MPPVSLKKLLGRKGNLSRILTELMDGSNPPTSILDASGELLWGATPDPGQGSVPILQDGLEIGRIQGGKSATSLAALLAYLVNQETEKKSLAAEVLERYRELNLLYNFSNKLATTPQPDAIATLALEEITHLVKARFGSIILKSEDSTEYRIVAAVGMPCHLVPGQGAYGELIERVIQAGKGELLNDITARNLLTGCGDDILSVMISPLKTEKRVMGAIILASAETSQYTAGDLKLLNTIAQQAAPAIEIARLYQMAIEKARLEHEIQMAHRVQTGLLPRAMPEVEGWAFSAFWCPARGVSGDFYDLIREKDDRLGMIIADVTDKSLPAALFMAFTRSVLHATIDRLTTPVESLTRANQLICLESNQGLFVTLFYAQLDLKTGEITYVNAGHNPPLLYRSRHDRLESLARTGLPLGIEVDATFQQNTVQMEPGDFLLFYTDGITEAFNSSEEQFGEDRLQEILLENRDATAEELVHIIEERVDAFTLGLQAADDITLLAAQRLSARPS